MRQEALLLARIGGQRVAFRAASVARIASAAGQQVESWLQHSVLGSAQLPERGLIAQPPHDRFTLAVDAVEGLHSLAASQLHPLPPLAQATLGTRGIEGLVEIDEQLLWLVDLQELFAERQEEERRLQEIEADAE